MKSHIVCALVALSVTIGVTSPPVYAQQTHENQDGGTFFNYFDWVLYVGITSDLSFALGLAALELDESVGQNYNGFCSVNNWLQSYLPKETGIGSCVDGVSASMELDVDEGFFCGFVYSKGEYFYHDFMLGAIPLHQDPHEQVAEFTESCEI